MNKRTRIFFKLWPLAAVMFAGSYMFVGINDHESMKHAGDNLTSIKGLIVLVSVSGITAAFAARFGVVKE